MSTPKDQADSPMNSPRDATTEVVEITTELPESLDLSDLLEEQTTVTFAGLTPADSPAVPTAVQGADGRLLPDSADAPSLKEARKILPNATKGELYTRNTFVDNSGSPDIDAILSESDLSKADFEAAGISLDRRQDVHIGQLRAIDDAVEIRDPRREALEALGFDVEYRWQIASDRYSIIQPSDATLRSLSAFQQHGFTDAFGAITIRDYGGEASIYIFIPSLEMEAGNYHEEDAQGIGEAIEAHAEEDTDLDVSDIIYTEDAEADADETEGDSEDDASADNPTTVIPGLCISFSHRGTSTFSTEDIALLPDSGAVFFGSQVDLSRRHDGSPNDAANERKHGRKPLSEWWHDALSTLETRATALPKYINQAKRTPVNFSAAPYTVEEFFGYLGLADKYASRAASIAQRLSPSRTVISLWALHVAGTKVLSADYDGSFSSAHHRALFDNVKELLINPIAAFELIYQNRQHELSQQEGNDVVAGQWTELNTVDDVLALDELLEDDGFSEYDASMLSTEVETTLADFN